MAGRLQRDWEREQLSKRKQSTIGKSTFLGADLYFSKPAKRNYITLWILVFSSLVAAVTVYSDETLVWRRRIQEMSISSLRGLESFLVAQTSSPSTIEKHKPVQDERNQGTVLLNGSKSVPQPAPPSSSPRISANVNPPGKQIIGYSINADAWGQYRTKGRINGRDVNFLVDTGATWVTVPDSIRWQLNLVRGEFRRIVTASDTYTGYFVRIDDLQVGPVHLRNVEGLLNPKAQNNEVLLGMSALKSLEVTHKNNNLVLKQTGVTVNMGAYFVAGQAPIYDNAEDNRRRLAEAKQKEDNCRYWKNHGLDYDLEVVRWNLDKYCR